MDLQLIEVYYTKENLQPFLDKIITFDIVTHWHSTEKENEELVRILVEKSKSEQILDFLELEAEHKPVHALLYNVHTYIPRPDDKQQKEIIVKKKEQEIVRASRQELYSVVSSSSKISKSFTWFLILSAVVATAGIIKDSAAVVIGAMVIAPLIGPFTALAFAAVLGDYKLMRQSLLTALYGLSIPLIIAILFGFSFDLPINSEEFTERTKIEMMDFTVALGAGIAGALSFIKRVSETLVGVMVSVALLPPTIVFGMVVGTGQWLTAITPLILLLVNISSIIFSALLVFWFSGIKPVNWQEIQAASTSRVYSLLFVSLIMLLLGGLIFLINI
ncbi:TIGR00341 family protein [Aquibacillus salsiterrae]|uniref:TIGR00341 family protein n=1 Tax=Aquibacillus salsiterrae TaxID=2950439 RepID=A0A9X3WEU1_9BACI|nr:TIGR00341 family protein [Aquibacillus salsiterrae]MDC3417703.1 TIGR00341 family protein [Aquibacillus salsiterrae]